MRFLADSNIVAQAVHAMRVAGHDVVYLGERTADPAIRLCLLKLSPKGGWFSPRTMISAFWFIVIDNRTVAYCSWTIWVMRRPNPA